MILADKKDYKQGYKKHYSAYNKLHNMNASINSKRLLLSYCVECGLKYLLLDKWHEENPKKIIENNGDSRKDVLTSHNLEKILKELIQQGTFKFPQMTTVHQDNITSDSYHQLCRYCIRVKENDKDKEIRYEDELRKIAEWIKEGM